MNIICFSYQYFHDSAFQRFTAEIALESMKSDIFEYVDYYMINQNLPIPKELLATKEGKLDLISVVYLDNIIPVYLRSHTDEFNYEESASYMLGMYNKILFSMYKYKDYRAKKSNRLHPFIFKGRRRFLSTHFVLKR